MKRRQVELYDDDTVMICWLDADRRIHPGVSVTLKEIPDRVWTVKHVWGYEADESQFHRKWNFDFMGKLPGLKIEGQHVN